MSSKIKALFIICLFMTYSISFYSQIFFEAEDYTDMSGVQTEGTSDEGGGINVGWIDNGDWMEYSINIPITGDYEISIRAASLSGGGVLDITSDGNSLGNITISATGDWQNWQTLTSSSLTINEGIQTIRLTATSGGFNLNWFELRLTNPTDESAPSTPVLINDTAGIHDISLTWTSSTDVGSAVVGYRIYNNDEFLAFSVDTSFSLLKLAPETEYNLSIQAFDLAGNSSSAAQVTISTKAIDWEIIWSDEFDGNEVDEDKWTFSVGPNNANNEEQYYTDGANSYVSDGILTLEAKIEDMGGMQYTSAKLTSRSKGDWVYGRIEVSAKMPDAGGTWPAIWMMPTNSVYGGWPNSGEIDILEHVGNNLGWAFGTVHTGAYNHSIGTQVGGGMTISDIHQNFHSYIIEWYPDRIDFYFDDIHYFTFENEYLTSAEWPYDQTFYLILNIAVGGDLGGVVHHEDTWPSKMEVDYVRVYDFNLGDGDTIAPSAPTNLKADPTGTSVTISWDQSIDDIYVEKYYIFSEEQLIDSSSGVTHTIIGLDPLSEYSFGIQAIDFGGNVSDTVFITITTTDIESYTVPGKIEAEDYLYMEGVQTEDTEDSGGGLNVGWIDTDDWMEYSIDVETAGEYYFVARAAAQSSNGSLQLQDEDDNVLITISIPVTGGWQNWESIVSESFTLNAGIQRIVIKALTEGFNLNWFDITNDPSEYLTSIFEENEEAFRIYPNPFFGNNLNIELSDNKSDVNVSIKNIVGKEIYQEMFYNPQEVIKIDNINVIPGIYIASITIGNETLNYKLIVN
ncbi:carbohydrate-binding protein [Bacteroidota bacterium]